MINFTSGAVINSEHSYWSTDDFTGFIIPSPPRRQGSAKTSRSVSDIVLRPVIAGSSGVGWLLPRESGVFLCAVRPPPLVKVKDLPPLLLNKLSPSPNSLGYEYVELKPHFR